MGCQCNKKEEDGTENELKRDSLEGMHEEFKENNNNNNNTKEIFGLNSEEGNNEEHKENSVKESNKENEKDDDYNERIAEEKNVKYGDYPEKMLEIINNIRKDPASYADIIEDSIKYIVKEVDKKDETKTRIIFKKKVKVALTKGEPAFREAAEKLRNMEPLPPFEFNEDINVPYPETVEEIKDPKFLKEQVKILRETTNIDLFFKDLIKVPEVSALLMVVDDSAKNAGRKRYAILNKEFKYMGINSHFIGKTFVAYFTFSK